MYIYSISFNFFDFKQIFEQIKRRERAHQMVGGMYAERHVRSILEADMRQLEQDV